MSLTTRITKWVLNNGNSTPADVLADNPDLTRIQVVGALNHCAHRGLLRVLQAGVAGGHGANRPPVYGKPLPPAPNVPPVNSVWDMADRARAAHFDERARQWP